MTQIIGMEITNSVNQFNRLNALKDKFETKLGPNFSYGPHDSRFEIINGVIHFNQYGYKVVAQPRIVKGSSNHLFYEYCFVVEHNDSEFEVWRFYLSDSGLLLKDTEEMQHVCDYDSDLVSRHFYLNISNGILKSKMFLVSVPPSA